MRLTHSVTITIEGRDDLTIEYDPEDTLPIAISQDPDGEDRKVLLSYEQYDVLADLIWAHRPDRGVPDALITGGTAVTSVVDRCVFGWKTGVGYKQCALRKGHETHPEWTHVSVEGWTYRPPRPAPF